MGEGKLFLVMGGGREVVGITIIFVAAVVVVVRYSRDFLNILTLVSTSV